MSKKRYKGQNTFGHYLLSFLLFIMLSVLSLSICFKAYIINPNTFSNMLTDRQYISALSDDIQQFASDECAKCYIADDFVGDVVNYDTVYNLEASYVHSALGTSNGYSDDAYQSNVDSFQDKLEKAIKAEVKQEGVAPAIKDGSTRLAQKITDYAKSKTEFVYIDKLQTMLNLSNALVTTVIVISAIASAIIAVVLFFKHSKRYRSLRLILFSVQATALFDFAMVLVVAFVRIIKDLVIYPTYLCSAIMSYVGASMLVVSLSGVVMLLVSLILITIIWRLKRGND